MTLPHQQIAKMHSLGYLTVSEAAELLSLHVTSVYRLAKLGKVEGSRFGSTWFVLRSSLVSYLEASDPPAPAEVIALVRGGRARGASARRSP